MFGFNNIQSSFVPAESLHQPVRAPGTTPPQANGNVYNPYANMRRQFDPQRVKRSFQNAANSPGIRSMFEKGRQVFGKFEQRAQKLFGGNHFSATQPDHPYAYHTPHGIGAPHTGTGVYAAQGFNYEMSSHSYNSIQDSPIYQQAFAEAMKLFQTLEQEFLKMYERACAEAVRAHTQAKQNADTEGIHGTNAAASAPHTSSPMPTPVKSVEVGKEMNKEQIWEMIQNMRRIGFSNQDLATLRKTLVDMQRVGDAGKMARARLEKDFAPWMQGIKDCDGVTMRNLIIELKNATTAS